MGAVSDYGSALRVSRNLSAAEFGNHNNILSDLYALYDRRRRQQ